MLYDDRVIVLYKKEEFYCFMSTKFFIFYFFYIGMSNCTKVVSRGVTGSVHLGESLEANLFCGNFLVV
jgi:hypothetical protein